MRRTAIIARQLFDGEAFFHAPEGAAVAFEAGKIVYAGPASDLPAGEWDTLSCPDCTLLPGLIDMHVHLTMEGNAHSVDEAYQDSSSMAMLRTVSNAEKQILHGVTYVRDCGCQGDMAIQLDAAVKSGLIKYSPKVSACGRVLCITGGHGTFVGRECDGAEELRKAARETLKSGASFLKMISTGGVISKGTKTGVTQLNADEVSAIVSEAEKVGVPTATHAHGTEGIKIALNAGVNTIEHASYVDDEGIDLFLKTGAMFTSTLLASLRELDHADELPAYMADKIRMHIERERDSVRRLISAGVPALGGTDAGTPFNPHGDLAQQLILLNEHGLSLINTLRASTSLAAKALRMERRIGCLKPGYAADILAVNGSVQDNLHALQDVNSVWRDGILMFHKGNLYKGVF